MNNSTINKTNLAFALASIGHIFVAEEREIRGTEMNPMARKTQFIPADSIQGKQMTGSYRGNVSHNVPHYGKKQERKDKARYEKAMADTYAKYPKYADRMESSNQGNSSETISNRTNSSEVSS